MSGSRIAQNSEVSERQSVVVEPGRDVVLPVVDEARQYEKARSELAKYAAVFRDKELAGFSERDQADLREKIAKQIEETKGRLTTAQQEFDKVNTWWPSGWSARWSGALAGARTRVQAEVKLYESLLEKQNGLATEFEQALTSSRQHLGQVDALLTKATGKTGAEGKQLLLEAHRAMHAAEQSLVIRGVDRTEYEGLQKKAAELASGKKSLLENFEIGGKELRTFAIWGTAALVTAAIALPLMAPLAASVTIGSLIWYGLAIPILAGVAGTAAGAAVGAVTSAAAEVSQWANGEQSANECFKDFGRQLSADVATAKDGAMMSATIISAGKFAKAGFGLIRGVSVATEAPVVGRVARALIPRVGNALAGTVGGTVGGATAGTTVAATANAAQEGLLVATGDKDAKTARQDFTSRTMDDGVRAVQLSAGTALAVGAPTAIGTVVGKVSRIPVLGPVLAVPLRLAGVPAAGAATGAANTFIESFGETYRTYRDFINANDIAGMSDAELALSRYQARREARITFWQFADRLYTNMAVAAVAAPLSRFIPQSSSSTASGFIRDQLSPKALAARGSTLLAETAVGAAAVSYRRNPNVDDVTEVIKHTALGHSAGGIYSTASKGRIR